MLVYSEVTNSDHPSIPAGVEAVRKLGAEHDFEVEATADSSVFNDADLGRFQAVVFNNTNSTPETGGLLNAEERAALQRYVRAGGGWVGLHSASASERDWEWYEGLVGAIFDKHPTPQTGRVTVLDHTHPSTQHLPDLWERQEEWYNWRANPTSKVHTLAQIKVRDGIDGLDGGVDHPFSWCQNYDGGRSWFTAGGHDEASFQEEGFVKHLLGGIQWAAGAAGGDCTATRTGSFERTPLATSDLADPFELAVAPDRRVFFAQRTGKLKVIDQETMKVSTALDFAYTPEMTSQSDGLLGLTLDPDFAENNWLYLLYSDKVEKRLNLSRFTADGNTVDPASEKRLLTVPTLRGEGRANSHMAGSLTFDKHGDLYAATGDNTDPFASDGFTPIDEGEGRRAWDAQMTAGNTNDLRGKALRITPEDDGTYSVPEGNLFSPGTEKTRSEIYAMGMRNPFRITTDPLSGALTVADYGPDARQAKADRGPEGTVEYTRITEAGNFGWPYCVGNNTPFNGYDFATKTSGAKFDCSALVNDSPNNTGPRELDVHTLGGKWIVVPSLPGSLHSPDGYREVARQFNRVGLATRESGLKLLYHNHGSDHEVVDGVSLYDILLNETDPELVGFELNLYWAADGGSSDPGEPFVRHRGRFPALHVKDMAPNGDIADVGSGILGFPAMFGTAQGGVKQCLVEHDAPADPFASARAGYRYLSRLRY